MVHEGSQNIQNNKMRALNYVTTQLSLVEIIFSLSKKRDRDFVKFVCPMKYP